MQRMDPTRLLQRAAEYRELARKRRKREEKADYLELASRLSTLANSDLLMPPAKNGPDAPANLGGGPVTYTLSVSFNDPILPTSPDVLNAAVSYEEAVTYDPYIGDNVFVGYWALSGSLTPTPTPLPAALPLFATGLGALGLLGWRRKRKARTAA
jgi:hypothetical protein